MDTSDLKARILRRIAKARPRAVWTPVDFLDLGSRDAVDKVLQRLVGTGDLRRIDRGLYDKPGINSLTQQPTAPDPREVIDAIARRDQIRVLVDGSTISCTAAPMPPRSATICATGCRPCRPGCTIS